MAVQVFHCVLSTSLTSLAIPRNQEPPSVQSKLTQWGLQSATRRHTFPRFALMRLFGCLTNPHQQSTKLKTIQYSIRDGRDNNDFEKTCIFDDYRPYQSYTQIENFGSLSFGFDLVVEQDPRQQSRNFKSQHWRHVAL